MKINDIYIYPVKSLGGIRVEQVVLESRGLQHDRRWMLVDENDRFISQRELPQLVLFDVFQHTDGFKIVSRFSDQAEFILPFAIDDGESFLVTIWEDSCSALEYKSGSAWFSGQLDIKCKLVYMPDTSHRFVEKEYANDNEIVAFSDAYPLLLIGQSSLDFLNKKLKVPIGMERFRPNLVIGGSKAFEEDIWKNVLVNKLEMKIAKPCARCVVPSINPKNAKKGKEPLATLAKFRSRDNKIYFGQNVLPVNVGSIKCGDFLTIVN